jgi:S1-C subfamily serine protease
MKKLFAIALALVLMCSLLPVGASAYSAVLSPQNLTVNGKDIQCEKYNIDGSNYFKLRDLAYLLRGTDVEFAVDYDAATNSVVIAPGLSYTPNGSELVIGADKSASAVPSAQSVWFLDASVNDLSIYNIGGNNFFKLRDLGTLLGFAVDFDQASNTAIVKTADYTAPAVPTGRAELSAEQVYARCVSAVFLIDVYDEYGDWFSGGSGFFIDGNGTAVTNHHVIFGGSSATVTVTDANGKETSYDVLGVYDWSDQDEEDWALIKVDVTGNNYLKLGDSSTVVGGATVYALGSPLGLSATISNGIISNPARYFEGHTYIQTNAAIDHGSSGGALINKYGEVIGITDGGFYGQNLNTAIPVTVLANAKTDSLTPISETYVIPSGYVEPAYYYVELAPGETFTNTITAIKADTDELLTVKCEVGDEDVVDYAWHSWTADDTTVDLDVTGLDYGSTYVAVYLYTSDSETLLDYCYFTVVVQGGEIEPETDYLELGVGTTEALSIQASSYDGRSIKMRYEIGNEDVIGCTWGDWSGDKIPLNISALSCGDTYVTVYMVDSQTDDIMAATDVYVTVIGGTLELSAYELEMAPGERKTVTISGAAFDGAASYITADDWDSDVIDWQRGSLGSGTVSLTITAKDEGWDCIYISLLDAAGNELNYAFIDVYVSADGAGVG